MRSVNPLLPWYNMCILIAGRVFPFSDRVCLCRSLPVSGVGVLQFTPVTLRFVARRVLPRLRR